MSKSSRKGALRENEWARKVGGEKVSRLGYEGPDVESPPKVLNRKLRKWEVKSKEDLPDWFAGPDGWIGQMRREGADAIVFRRNRDNWFLLVELDYPPLDLIDAALMDEPRVDQNVRGLEGDLGGLQGLEALEHPSESGDLGGKVVDLRFQLGDTVSPELQEAIALVVRLLADARP